MDSATHNPNCTPIHEQELLEDCLGFSKERLDAPEDKEQLKREERESPSSVEANEELQMSPQHFLKEEKAREGLQGAPEVVNSSLPDQNLRENHESKGDSKTKERPEERESTNKECSKSQEPKESPEDGNLSISETKKNQNGRNVSSNREKSPKNEEKAAVLGIIEKEEGIGNENIDWINVSILSGKTYSGISVGFEECNEASLSCSRSQISALKRSAILKHFDEDPFTLTKEVLEKINFVKTRTEPSEAFLAFLSHFEKIDLLKFSVDEKAKTIESFLLVDALCSEFKRLDCHPLAEQAEVLKNHLYNPKIEEIAFPFFEETEGENLEEKFANFLQRIYRLGPFPHLDELQSKMEEIHQKMEELRKQIGQNSKKMEETRQTTAENQIKRQALVKTHSFLFWLWQTRLRKKLILKEKMKNNEILQGRLAETMEQIERSKRFLRIEQAQVANIGRSLQSIQRESTRIEEEKRKLTEMTMECLKMDDLANKMRKEATEKHLETKETQKRIERLRMELAQENEKFKCRKTKFIERFEAKIKKEKEEKERIQAQQYSERIQREANEILRKMEEGKGLRAQMLKEKETVDLEVEALEKELRNSSVAIQPQDNKIQEKYKEQKKMREEFFKGLWTFIGLVGCFALFEALRALGMV